MASINKENIEKYLTDKGFEKTMLNDFLKVKSKKDKEKFEADYKNTLEGMKQSLMEEEAYDLYQQILQSNPELAGMERAEIMSLPDFQEQLGKVYGQEFNVIYGVPDNLFVKDENLDSKDRLAATRAKFNSAGLDYDNPDDRMAAAKSAAITTVKEGNKNAKKEPKNGLEKYGAAVEGVIGSQTPRSDAKVEAGEEVTYSDALADLLRLGEAGTPILGVPSIIARNILEGALDEKGIKETVIDAGKDLGLYLATAGMGSVLNKFLPRRSSKITEELLKGEKGSGDQLVKATQYALDEGKKPNFLNPYVEQAVEEVEKAGLTEPQKKKFSGMLSKYLGDFDAKKLTEKAAESSTNKTQLGSKALEEQINKEAKNLGNQALKNTKEVKFDFDEIKGFLTEKEADDLALKLASSGTRDAEGFATSRSLEFGKNNETARRIIESEAIRKWLSKNPEALKRIYGDKAAANVMKTYGTSMDEQFMPLVKFIVRTPVAYNKPISKAGAWTAAKTAGNEGLRKYLVDSQAGYNFKEE